MKTLTGISIVFMVVHGIMVVRTGYSSFYWASRMLFNLEALQNGMVRSLPHWIERWKQMMNEERKEMHNAREHELLSRMDGVGTAV